MEDITDGVALHEQGTTLQLDLCLIYRSTKKTCFPNPMNFNFIQIPSNKHGRGKPMNDYTCL